MLKFLVLTLLAATAIAKTQSRSGVPASKEFLNRQLSVLQLLEKVHVPYYYEEYQGIAQNFHPLQQLRNYRRTEGIQQFVRLYQQQQLKPKGQPFSIHHPEDRQEARYLFESLYYAKDWDTFYKTAVLARSVANEEVYVYALTTAVIHREDTRGIRLPPQYEIFPEYYIHSQAIHQAYQSRYQGESSIISVNSSWYSPTDDEGRVRHYSDDVGLNAHNQIWSKQFPSWWQQDEYSQPIDRLGEFYYYSQHQLLNRYNLERQSQGLPEISEWQWQYQSVRQGYNPHAVYRNGEEFPPRYDNLQVQDVHNQQYGDLYVRDVQEYEQRIREAVDSQSILTGQNQYSSLNSSQGIDVLGQVLYGSESRPSPTLYGSVSSQSYAILGRVVDPQGRYNLAPSAIEQEVGARDPLYYSVHQHLDQIFRRHKYSLQPYSREQIEFRGVRVEGVEVSDLETYVEQYDVDLENIFDDQHQQQQGQQQPRVQARVERQNHKPFSYQINVNSDSQQTAVVRIYLAPQQSYSGRQYSVEQQSWRAIELDTFVTTLQSGQNTIQRKSRESSVVTEDTTTSYDLKIQVQQALQGQSQYIVNKDYSQCGIPARLLIPRGSVGGQQYSLIVSVSDYQKEKVDESSVSSAEGQSYSLCGAQRQKYPLAYALGYPLDRAIPDSSAFKTGNVYFKDVTIRHRQQQQA